MLQSTLCHAKATTSVRDRGAGGQDRPTRRADGPHQTSTHDSAHYRMLIQRREDISLPDPRGTSPDAGSLGCRAAVPLRRSNQGTAQGNILCQAWKRLRMLRVSRRLAYLGTKVSKQLTSRYRSIMI